MVNTDNMKALVLNSFGVAPVLQTVDTPVAQTGQVLIKLKGSGLNPLDVKIMAGEAKHVVTGRLYIYGRQHIYRYGQTDVKRLLGRQPVNQEFFG